ncbi:hypothetical protein [Myroides sp. LoEW2-1]|uniref:hypothetical protein n=1 Tax=Myroides sp. LoEW2-1 TaxID=2683192 RepID=UPI001320B39D|nr:hypothetical protein [Myroides sp. LoEW2-1]MVX35865.1 hypothetical protein [Myroides sp. LoEW2-1]
MKKKYLKNLLLASSFSAVVGVGIYSYACADGYWSYAMTSSFTPEAFVDKSYQPMFFAPYERFYNNQYISNTDVFHNNIVEDWSVYLGNKVSKEAIAYYLLDDSDSENNSRLLYLDLNKKKNKSGKYGLDLKDERVMNFVTFLNIAKRIDAYSSRTYDYWNYSEYVEIPVDNDIVTLSQQFYDKMNKSDKFFSNRMWFQVLKAKFYSGNRQSVISYFEHTAHKQEKNTLYYRGLGYVAGAYYQAGNYETSNLLYAEIYNAEPQLRQIATYNFKPLDNTAIQRIVEMTDDVNVQTAIWAIMGYYKDEISSMKQIYAIDPSSPHIDYLLTRWVNVQEQEVNIPTEHRFKSKADYFKSVEGKIDQSTYQWIRDVSNKKQKLHNPVLWKLTLAYLDIFQGSFSSASKYLEDAKALVKSDDVMIQDQIRLFSLINAVSQVEKVDSKVEARLLTEMQWLFQNLNTRDYSDPFRYEYAAHWVKRFLSTVYKENNNTIMAEVLVSEGPSYYSNLKQSREMEEYLLSKNKSAFEQLFVDSYGFNLSDIYESRALYFFYQDKIEEAIVEMEKAQPVKRKNAYFSNEYETLLYKDTELLGNPFNGNIKDCNDCDHQAKQRVKYTKLSFLKKIKEMKDKIAKGEDVYNNALLLGNAFYNTTYFGNARVFYYNSILNEYGSNSISSNNKAILLSMKLAEKYYAIAQKQATTREQKAKLAYFEAKIERNNFYVKEYHSKDYYYGAWGDDIMFKKWKGFAKLKEQYSDTNFYQEVIQECEYFDRYQASRR